VALRHQLHEVGTEESGVAAHVPAGLVEVPGGLREGERQAAQRRRHGTRRPGVRLTAPVEEVVARHLVRQRFEGQPGRRPGGPRRDQQTTRQVRWQPTALRVDDARFEVVQHQQPARVFPQPVEDRLDLEFLLGFRPLRQVQAPG
jgi:hypothetical protein